MRYQSYRPLFFIAVILSTALYLQQGASSREARFGVSRAEATPLGRAAWRAPNPAAGYDAYVTEEGVTIALNDKVYVSLILRGIGYGHAMQAVAPGEVSGDKQTINITRDSGAQEWFVNGPDGLEHGFTLSEPPGARNQGTPLRLALQVSKGWRAVAGSDGKLVTLRGPDGRVVEYGKLVVNDGLGRKIPARLTVAGEQVVIEVEDHDAAYPLTIDPLFTLQQKLAAADGEAGDYFGAAVALDGDTLAVGALYDDVGSNANQGSVYVFTRSGSAWTLQQKLTAFDGATKDLFGSAIALSGDTLAVGASGADVGSNANQGSVYVFTRSGATPVWTLQQKLTANDGEAQDRFGGAVALDGDTLVVGAYGDDLDGNPAQGSAYVFTRDGAVWTQQQKLTASGGAAEDYFGYAVALDGDTLAVGAYGVDSWAHPDKGSVYVFTRSGATWAEQQKLATYGGGGGNFFGIAVALDGDTLAVGASADDIGGHGNGGNIDQGSVYVFTRSGGTWTQQQKLIANDGSAFDAFGSAVALDGDTLVVGAPFNDSWSNSDQGSAYVFTRSGGTWTLLHKPQPAGGAPDVYFGYAVALDGDTLTVGASGDDINANPDQGSVYVYVRPSCPALTFEPASLPGGVKGKWYQRPVTVSGGAGPYQYGLSGGALPPGLTLAPNGLLSGEPALPGVYNFTISATDLTSFCSGNRAYSITIISSCPTVTIDQPMLPDGETYTPYSETLTATGGSAPYKFFVKGALPLGLSLSEDGVLSGTPTQSGSFHFIVIVIDAYGCVGSRAYTMTIMQVDIGMGAAQPANGHGRQVAHSRPATRSRRG